MCENWQKIKLFVSCLIEIYVTWFIYFCCGYLRDTQLTAELALASVNMISQQVSEYGISS